MKTGKLLNKGPKVSNKNLKTTMKFKQKSIRPSAALSHEEGDEIDEKFGFERYKESVVKLGWLLNFLPVNLPDDTNNNERSALDLYFIDQNGENFKASVYFDSYFYLSCGESDEKHVIQTAQHIRNRIEGCHPVVIDKEDLDLPNHLSGRKHRFIKLSFSSIDELNNAKSFFKPVVAENRRRVQSIDYESVKATNVVVGSDPLSCIVDIREHDISYSTRAAIDLELRVGAWYNVMPSAGSHFCTVEWQKDMLELCEPRILAFDIECVKSPLKFPNAERDQIFMISYMTQGQGYLLINREVVTEDISDFEYTPQPKYPGPFKVFNEKNEEDVLRKFVMHLQEIKPHVVVTYNGDFFDWPYVQARCSKLSNPISLYKELGIKTINPNETALSVEPEFTGRCMVHLDAFCWVKRDSYLPQGTQGLKAVTRNKLGYDPVEVDPEDMLRFAEERPDYMASYSVSDAVATFYLYTTYVHNFIFSLSTIIPMGSEDVLRKGSGTLCEALLMVEAFRGNIICPNKQNDGIESFYKGHLLESETYIGGHVECLEAGVFRADIPVKFHLKPLAIQHLIDRIDKDLSFAIETEHGLQRSDITNYDDIRQNIVEKLEMLRDCPIREEKPVIYHLDVGAMYPNIILTNRLQPSAMVSVNDCANCAFNKADSNCKRKLPWTWRGEHSPASMQEYQSIKRQLSFEIINQKIFSEMSEKEQAGVVKDRLKLYSKKVYKESKVTTIEERVSTVCQRENPFYVNTVRDFRDRRYDYKLLTKVWKSKKIEAEKCGDLLARKAAEDKEVLMDSLQLAHKCILNSFYGYVMRKGARWRSMEMAGIVTHTGAQLIMQARELVEQVGRPLELDTDGIWCILPSSFPQDFKLITSNGKSFSVGYPCAMLNADVHDRYTNHQYQDLSSKSAVIQKYNTKSECSIFFELDGPYRAMILPASPEEGRLLKKKYVVFNLDGSLAELKGFELKRRGELEIVKIFQSQVFDKFLAGNSLIDCYQAVGEVANQWLDVLDSKGCDMNDDELLELISERKTISKTLDDYEGRKATSLTTANRLADFLGEDMVKDKGLNCHLIISKYPIGAPVTERAIPVAIFNAEDDVKKYRLRKWLKDPSLLCVDFREIVDWDYYKERLGKTIQKIITIPAGMQRVANPVPRVVHPIWLQKTINDNANSLKQTNLISYFNRMDNKVLAPKLLSVTHHKSPEITESLDKLDVSCDINERKREIELVDLEDILKNTNPKSKSISDITPTTASNENNSQLNNLQPVVLLNVLDEKLLTPESNFDEWLKSRQNTWKQNRVLKKKLIQQLNNRSLTSDQYAIATGRKKTIGVADFVRNASLAALYNHWQIIEIQSTSSPGEFIVWTMTSKTQLQKLKIIAPRVLYVNCVGKLAETTAVELGGSKVQRDLPHGRPIGNLFEVSIPEKKYVRNEKVLSLFLSHPSVEGVYESQVPLLFRSIVSLGCVALPRLQANQQANQRLYKLPDFDFVHVNSHPYLDKSTAIYKRIYIYYVSDKNKKNRGTLGLFVVESTNQSDSQLLTGQAFVWLVSPNVDVSTKPPFQRLYRRHQSDESATVKFISSSVTTFKEAFLNCNEKIRDYSSKHNGPTIAVAQGVLDSLQWRQLLSSLQDFPLAVMPGNAIDEKFPAIGWQLFVAERMIQRYLIFPRWFMDRLNCARHSHIPVCNLGTDSLTTMTDVAFARVLHQGRHLLWASEEHEPDIGGSDSSAVNQYFVDEDMDPSINEPGVYRNVCVELDVFGMVVAAIMNSALLDTQGLGNNNINLIRSNKSKYTTKAAIGSSDASCGKAFNLLKAIVSKWMDDFRIRNDSISDSMLTSLHRYLCGYGDGLLFDPLLHRLVNSLMSKLFKRLIYEFKRLGTKLIYADFNRIIVNTDKMDTESAKEYIEFILLSIGNNEIFSCLEITPKEYWLQLLWLDSDNFGGLKPKVEKTKVIMKDDDNNNVNDNESVEAVQSKGEYDFLNDIEDMIIRSRRNDDDSDKDDDDDRNSNIEVGEEKIEELNDENELECQVISHWSIAQYLPTAAKEFFHFIISEYMIRYRVKLQNYIVARSSYLSSDINENETTTDENLLLSDEDINAATLIYMKSLVSESLTNRMLSLLDELSLVYPSTQQQPLPAYTTNATNTTRNHVALDFVNITAHVLAIDITMVDEIAALKRVLLAQLRIREFSSLSIFVDPTPSYLMKDIICSYCSTCRDIDLLKKSVEFDSSNNKSTNNNAAIINCEHCHSALDMEEIENRLLDEIEKASVGFLLQDFRCPRTKQSSTRLLASYSNLAASLVPDISPKDITKQFIRMRLVAKQYNFVFLLELINGILLDQGN